MVTVAEKTIDIIPAGRLTARVNGSADYLSNRHGKRAALALQNEGTFTLHGVPALLEGESGTVELFFSPDGFVNAPAPEWEMEFRLTSACRINAIADSDWLTVIVTENSERQRHRFPVYSWRSYGKLPQLLTITRAVTGVRVYLNGEAAGLETGDVPAVSDSGAVFRLCCKSRFAFVRLQITPGIYYREQAMDSYAAVLLPQKTRDRPLIRVPRSRRVMSRSGEPALQNFDDAAEICGMSDVATNQLIQSDLRYFLKYDEEHFYILSAAPTVNRRNLSFFAMLKYSETFDQESFTINPWKPVLGYGARSSKWFTRSARTGKLTLDEAWIESFSALGIAPPKPHTRWDANFASTKWPVEHGVWYQSEQDGIRSYGVVVFGAPGELFARSDSPPEISADALVLRLSVVNPGNRPQGYTALAELFQPDGELVSQASAVGVAAPDAEQNQALDLKLPAKGEWIFKVCLTDDHEQVFFRRTLNIRK